MNVLQRGTTIYIYAAAGQLVVRYIGYSVVNREQSEESSLLCRVYYNANIKNIKQQIY